MELTDQVNNDERAALILNKAANGLRTVQELLGQASELLYGNKELERVQRYRANLLRKENKIRKSVGKLERSE